MNCVLMKSVKTTQVFYWASVHLQSEDKRSICLVAEAPGDAAAEAIEPVRAVKLEEDDTVNVVGGRCPPITLQLQTECCTEPSSPPKMASSVSLAESVQSASHSESFFFN